MRNEFQGICMYTSSKQIISLHSDGQSLRLQANTAVPESFETIIYSPSMTYVRCR